MLVISMLFTTYYLSLQPNVPSRNAHVKQIVMENLLMPNAQQERSTLEGNVVLAYATVDLDENALAYQESVWSRNLLVPQRCLHQPPKVSGLLIYNLY